MVNFSKEIIKEEQQIEKSIKKLNSWMIVSCVLAVLLVIAVVMVFVSKGISQKAAEEKLLTNLNGMVGGGVTIINSTKLGNLYEVSVLYQSQVIPVYITKDGKYMVMGVQEIVPAAVNTNTNTPTSSTSTPTEIVKSDKPKVELFIMSYCPYGTQAEKGIIPAFEALGTSADTKIRFVHYTMHGEKEDTENSRQLCIREEQSAKFLPYLKCFLNASDATGCLKSTGVDTTKLNTCMGATGKVKDYYAVDSRLSNQYGVQGSPTLIINGVESSAGRNSASYLAGICSAFNTAPSACSKTLSTTNPSSGFGYGVTGAAASSSCGA